MDSNVSIKMMNVNFSIEKDDKGNIISIDNDTNYPPTRRVLVEKYIIRYVEMDIFGETVMAKKSVYEEPLSFDNDLSND